MKRLSQDTLGLAQDEIRVPAYDRTAAEIGIVHLGPGAFHRGHQAVYTEDAMERSGGNWGICAVSLNSQGVYDALSPQDGLYTLAIKDKVPSYRIIGAIKEVLCAPMSPEKVIARLTSEATKIVTLTITEKGYALNSKGRLDVYNNKIAADLKQPKSPISAIGYLVLACALRRDAGLPPLTMISCDNLPDNGDKLKAACIHFANLTDPKLSCYIAEHVRFPNTMVDSITPATDEGTISDVARHIGLEDASPIQREGFKQWVIEDNLPDDMPDWAGAGAIITHDVAGFEKTKLRILNGAHSTLTYLGLLAGEVSVEDAINNSSLHGFVDGLISSESIPTIDAPSGLNLNTYWEQIIARFENPHIRHLLEQISHDGSQKIPARIFPVILHHMKQGVVARHACFVVAAWIAFNHSRRLAEDNPVDAYLDQIADQLPSVSHAPDAYARVFLNIGDVFPSEMSSNDEVSRIVIMATEHISRLGIIAAIKALNL